MGEVWWWVDLVADISFFIDIILNFMTGYNEYNGEKTVLFSHFYIKNEHFTKTGSGQTWGKALKKIGLVAFCAGSVVCAARRDHFEHDDRLRRHGFHPSSDKRTLDAKGKACARWCEKKVVFFLRAIFYCNPSIWPRQARGKYTTVGKVENEADVSAGVVGVQLAATTGEKNVLFEPFLYKNDLFTKTGSGQT